jgi:hypothetical protein
MFSCCLVPAISWSHVSRFWLNCRLLQVVAQMRDMVSNDAQNPVSNSFLLDDDLRLVIQKISSKLQLIDFSSLLKLCKWFKPLDYFCTIFGSTFLCNLLKLQHSFHDRRYSRGSTNHRHVKHWNALFAPACSVRSVLNTTPSSVNALA